MATIEVTNREAALNKPIESDNKGYLLLQKMMTKRTSEDNNPTQTTINNKEPSTSSSVTEELSTLIAKHAPISIEVKTNRRGLGESHLPLRKRIKYTQPTEAERELRDQQRTSDFLTHKRTQTAALLTRKDYFNCQKVCANLESAKESPSLEWYWPKAVLEAKQKTTREEKEADQAVNESEEDAEEEVDYVVRLAQLNEYLREEHQYCIWCALAYDSPQELKSSCPGGTREDHDL